MATPAEALAAVDVDGLRPYRPGTSASRIHWPAVARGAGLIERRLRADGDSRPLVVLDARGSSARAGRCSTPPCAPPPRWCSSSRRAGGCGLLLPGEQRATAIDRELSRWPAAYRAPGAGRRPQAGHADRRCSGRPRAGSGAMIYVAARPPERLARR